MKNIFANTFSKTEKIIITILLALFVVPEVLWSPVVNILYAFYNGTNEVLRPNFLMNEGALGTLRAVFLIQFLGLFFSFLFLSFLKRKISNIILRRLTIIILGSLSLVVFLLWAVSWMELKIGW